MGRFGHSRSCPPEIRASGSARGLCHGGRIRAHAVGLELTAGAGRTFGDAPEYNRFFGGSASRDFLYSPLASSGFGDFPTGPLLRSVGVNGAALSGIGTGLGGGTWYLHLNADVSIPIPRWSRALIPDIPIERASGSSTTMRKALIGQAGTAKASILDDLVATGGYPDNADTEAIVDRMVNRDIRPALTYLANRANVYAVKPMWLVDIARLSTDAPSRETWTAVGPGLQLNVVNARLQVGYLRTVSGSSENAGGNFFVRLTIQNFF